MIKFKTVRWKNLLSTGKSFTEIQLDKNHTTILLGESGSGKSTILDAITFALFNKPFRAISKPQLVNAINEKDCRVEIEFDIGNKEYKIIRGIKPNIFEIWCDGSLMNQDANARDYQDYLEKQILKFNFKAFTQIVVLGAAGFTPFMQLKPIDRRTIIEGLLDIEIFSVMNTLLKQRVSAIKQSISDNEMSITILKEKIAIHQKYLEDLSKNKAEKIAENMKQIEENQVQIQSLEEKNKLALTDIEKLEEQISFKTELLKEIESLKDIQRKLLDRTKKLDKEIQFYHEHDDCSQCGQTIPQEFKEKQIESKNDLKSKVEEGIKQAETKIDSVSSRLEEVKKIEKEIEDIQFQINKNNNSIDAIKKFIKKVAKETIDLKNEAKAETKQDAETIQFNQEIEKLEAYKQKLSMDRTIHDMAATLLKDGGVKARIIKQYLPLINKYTNQFLNRMNFFVSFQMNEEFEEQIKSRGRDAFCYANFSEGEKQRIDLALLFTWRTIAKMKNSVNTNLLIMDEVLDSYLDTHATENVLQLLNSELFKDTNIFVISHKETISDKFQANIRFTKKKNFSMIE